MSPPIGSLAQPQPKPPHDWPRGFMVLHGNRLEDLRQVLIEHLKAHPLPGLETEWVVVQSNGMKQWLEQGMAQVQGLGVCAATRMVFPAELLWLVYRGVLGPAAVPEHLPLDREHLIWRLLRLLPEWLQGDPLKAHDNLRRYVFDAQGSIDESRLFQLCQQLASLYDGYQNYRADWLRAWALGHGVLIDSNGVRSDLPAHGLWQMQLWQTLLDDVQTTHPAEAWMPSRAEVHQAAMQRMHAARPAQLPKRVLVFGVSALPMQTIEALAALGQHAQVMVFVLNPSRHHWGHLVHERQVLTSVLKTRQSTKDQRPVREALLAASTDNSAPLLAAWGQQGRDFLHLLDVHDHVDHYRHLLGRIDCFEEPLALAGPNQANRLQHLQSDILNLNPLPGEKRPCPHDDDSFTFIRAHSPLREVELLQDQILSWLDADPQLQPRDIMVMVPDMTPYAALIHAVWGRFSSEDPKRIPYSVSDQGAKDHPMAAIVQAMLMGNEARFTLEDWLSWLEVPAFARAFGFPMPEWAQVRQVLHQVGIRWGLDSTHRLQSGVALSAPSALPNTWMFGLHRLLLTQAQGQIQNSPWQNIWPTDDGESISPEALNALCHSLQTLRWTLNHLQKPRSPAQWVKDLIQMVDSVLQPQTEADEKTKLALTAPLQQWLQSCQVANLVQDVSLQVVRTHWLTSLQETLTGQSFLGSGVQFATLLPMRSIPFKRVCLLGMNDGQYPRRQPQTDFDLMRWDGQRRPGDRSKREDDRYLFLEALLCAREKVYISWQGWQLHDQAPMYPSVLVGQLMAHLDAVHATPVSVRDAPMQAYSKLYFEQACSPWRTYAQDWAQARGWRAESNGLPSHQGSDSDSTVDPLPDTLKLSALIGLLRQPLDVYYHHRLKMAATPPEPSLPDAEPFELNALELHRWVLQAFDDPTHWVARAQASGSLPLGDLSLKTLSEIQAKAEVLGRRQAQALGQASWQAMGDRVLDWSTPLTGDPTGVKRITGTLGGRHWYQNDLGQVLQMWPRAGSLAKDKALQIHHMLAAWANHLLANACGLHCTTHVLGLDQTQVLAAMSVQDASDQLCGLLQAYTQAWSTPLALPGRTACAWMAEYHKPRLKGDENQRRTAAHQVARGVFDGTFKQIREPEKTSVPMMRRHAREYADVRDTMEPWAMTLYMGLIQALGLAMGEGVSDHG